MAIITTDVALDMADDAGEKWEPSDTELALSILGEEVRALRARVAELEAERGEPETDYGVVWPDGHYRSMGGGCEGAWGVRSIAEYRRDDGARACRREVRTVYGPWQELDQ